MRRGDGVTIAVAREVRTTLPLTVKPTQLLLAFFGEFVLDRADREQMPARVIIDVLGHFGVTESNVRVTLGRMVKSGLLVTVRTGRTTAYTLTEHAVEVLRDGASRVRADEPFGRPGSVWTLLSYSVPEARRGLRHQVRSRLQWFGFGRVRDGLWIAPGEVDVAHVLDEIAGDDVVAFAFAGHPIGEASTELVSAAWDLDALRADHEGFVARWSSTATAGQDPLAAQVAMYADWLELLRRDPGLPAEFLPGDWPASRSVETFRAASRRRADAADARLQHLIDESMRRR